MYFNPLEIASGDFKVSVPEIPLEFLGAITSVNFPLGNFLDSTSELTYIPCGMYVKEVSMILFVIIGMFSLIVGIWMLLSPGSFYRFSESLNKKVVTLEEKTSHHAVAASILFIIIGVIFFFIACNVGI